LRPNRFPGNLSVDRQTLIRPTRKPTFPSALMMRQQIRG
jgi:hypothetical protein